MKTKNKKTKISPALAALNITPEVISKISDEIKDRKTGIVMDPEFSHLNDDISKNNIVSKAASEFSKQSSGVEETLKRTRDAMILSKVSEVNLITAIENLTAALRSFDSKIFNIVNTNDTNKTLTVTRQYTPGCLCDANPEDFR